VAVVGPHPIPTADETVHPGTAYLTDVGMTGAFEGVIGFSRERIIEKFFSQTPRSFETASGYSPLSGRRPDDER
jgi:calcineurin-like phosphoesterase